MALVLHTLANTVFKQRPIQSGDLPDREKTSIPKGREFDIDSFSRERNHVRFSLKDDAIEGFDTWYAFGEHVEIAGENNQGTGSSQVYPKPRPRAIQLECPYLWQLDNFENPTGACNVTSVAMCLKYFRIPQRTNASQFEDELYRYAIDNNLSRHSPYDLAKIIRDYGCTDEFRTNATIDEVKDWVADLNPAIVHGYFTSFGHILVVVGYDERGFFVHDPYGEWFPSGYRTDLPGAYLHYSYNLIRQVCIPDGNFWVHFVSK
ncbi:peptidoglycan-binding protein [Leptolyngbya valderiana BDU 20041]|nr:peptidoglycan-binding protein [Leptolyngbya valderiana BDU 20041]